MLYHISSLTVFIFTEYILWVINNSKFEVCFSQKQDIFSEFFFYVPLRAVEKNLFRKTVGRLITKA